MIDRLVRIARFGYAGTVTGAITITVKALRACVLAAERRGVPPTALLGPIGVDPALLMDTDAHVPFAWVAQVWTQAPLLAGDPAFGLHAAEMVVGKGSHIIDYVAEQCGTPREILQTISRYQRLLMSHTVLRLEVAGPVATFVHPPDPIPMQRPPHLEDFVVAQWALICRARSRGFPLRRVTFLHARPPDTREHERLFQAPVEFGARQGAIEFDAELLDIPLERADPLLRGVLLRYGDGLLATAETVQPSLQERLRSHLAGQLPSGGASIEKAARTLGMSSRSLQRQLQTEGTAFKDVVEAVRRDLALVHMREDRHSISEVAFLAGFTEVSAFSRAFRRWTGASPTAWRRDNLAPAHKSRP